MKGKAVSVIMPSLLLIGMLTMAFNLKIAQASPETIIYVDPQSIIDTSKVAGTTFSVDISIANVEDLYSYEFRLSWNGPLLNVTNVVEGPFLKTGGSTYFTRKIWNTPDPVGVSDYIYVADTLYGVPAGVSGSGLLATVTFLVEGTGESTLDLHSTILVGSFLDPILHTHEDGYFTNGAAPPPEPMIYVDPSSIDDPSKVPGATFSVDISIANVEDLYSYEFKLSWNGLLLNVTNVVEGPFLKTGGSTYFTRKIWNTPDPAGVSDYIYVADTLYGVPAGVSGSGLLATVTFLVEGTGESTLDLHTTMLIDSFADPISHTHEDGYFTNGEAAPDFSVSASPTALTIVQGSSDTSTITVTSVNDFSSAVALSLSGQPVGVTYTFTPASVTPPADGSDTSTFTVEVDLTASVGDYTLTVTGTSGALVHTVDVSLAVTELPPEVTIVYIDPPEGTAPIGDTYTIDINIDAVEGLSSWEVKLTWDSTILYTDYSMITEGDFLSQGGAYMTYFAVSLTPEPPAPQAIIGCMLLEPVTTSGSGTLATVTFTVTSEGETPLDLFDTSLFDIDLNPIPHTAEDGYFSNIAAEPDFSITASPTSLTIEQDSSDTSTITITSLNGFSAPVDLTVSGEPLGVTAAFVPTSVTPPADGSDTSTLTVTVGAMVTPDTYTLTVTGTSGALSHTVEITLTVTPRAQIYVAPPMIIDVDLKTFSVNINIEDVVDLFAWEVKIGWSASILDHKDSVEGAFLQQEGSTFFTYSEEEDEIGTDYVLLSCTLFGPQAGVSGNGTLATVTFKVQETGETVLDLFETTLIDSYVNPIDHEVEDGYFCNINPDFSISAEPDSLIIEQGASDTSTITVASLYGFVDPVNLTVSTVPLGVTVTLNPTSVTPPADDFDTSTLTVQVDLTASLGFYNLTVTGTSGTLVHSVNISLEITAPPAPLVLSIKLSGEHDYVDTEEVKIRLTALLMDVNTTEPVSDVDVTIKIYDPNGNLWLSDVMVEKLGGTGVYEWESDATIAELTQLGQIEKGVYLVLTLASYHEGPTAYDILQFHIDPPPRGSSNFPIHYYAIAVSAILASVLGMILLRRHISTRLRAV